MTEHDDDWVWLPAPLSSIDWVEREPGYLRNWAKWKEWRIGVKLEPLADGRLVITGLRVEPLTQSGSGAEHRQLSAEKLRTLPWKYLLKLATLHAHSTAGTWQQIPADIQAVQDAGEEVTYGVRHGELLRAARAYRHALAHPELGPTRDQVAQALLISKRTVDRRLNAARQAGVLEPYFGNQGKHGKSQNGDTSN